MPVRIRPAAPFKRLTMIFAHWDPEHGIALPDNAVDAWAQSLLTLHQESGEVVVEIGSETLVDALRLLVCRGQVKPEDLAFICNGEILTVNEGGRLPVWPKGFCDKTISQVVELSQWRRANKKEADLAGAASADC